MATHINTKSLSILEKILLENNAQYIEYVIKETYVNIYVRIGDRFLAIKINFKYKIITSIRIDSINPNKVKDRHIEYHNNFSRIDWKGEEFEVVKINKIFREYNYLISS